MVMVEQLEASAFYTVVVVRRH